MFVVGLDRLGRRVIVGPREALRVDHIALRDLNWLGSGAVEDLPEGGLDIAVRIRSTGKPRSARLTWSERGATVAIVGGEAGVSPGQACGLYADPEGRARVLGGGIIAGTTAMARVAAAAGGVSIGGGESGAGLG